MFTSVFRASFMCFSLPISTRRAFMHLSANSILVVCLVSIDFDVFSSFDNLVRWFLSSPRFSLSFSISFLSLIKHNKVQALVLVLIYGKCKKCRFWFDSLHRNPIKTRFTRYNTKRHDVRRSSQTRNRAKKI